MRDFAYHRPATLVEAGRLAAEPDAALLAGGQGLVLDMRARRRSPGSVVDLADVLPRAIRLGANGSVMIGAGATHADVASSPIVRERLSFLADLAGHVGDPAIRHRGTLGGALAVNDPAGDWPAACLALEAEIFTTERVLSANEFLAGRGTTVLRVGEIVLEVAFPAAERGAYLKFLNPASRYALVGAFVAFASSTPRIAITGARIAGAFRWREAEAHLTISSNAESLADLMPTHVELVDDFFADPAFRGALAGVLTRRAVSAALGRSPSIVAIVHGAPMHDHPRPS